MLMAPSICWVMLIASFSNEEKKRKRKKDILDSLFPPLFALSPYKSYNKINTMA